MSYCQYRKQKLKLPNYSLLVEKSFLRSTVLSLRRLLNSDSEHLVCSTNISIALIKLLIWFLRRRFGENAAGTRWGQYFWTVQHIKVVKLYVYHLTVRFVSTGLWERLWLLALVLMTDILSGFLYMLHAFYHFFPLVNHFVLFLCSLTPEWHGGWDHRTNKSFSGHVEISI